MKKLIEVVRVIGKCVMSKEELMKFEKGMRA